MVSQSEEPEICLNIQQQHKALTEQRGNNQTLATTAFLLPPQQMQETCASDFNTNL